LAIKKWARRAEQGVASVSKEPRPFFEQIWLSEVQKCPKGPIKAEDNVTNRQDWWDESDMQCEEAGDWLSVGAGLLSLAKLMPVRSRWNINYASFQYQNR
jgi:hypothetical protein